MLSLCLLTNVLYFFFLQIFTGAGMIAMSFAAAFVLAVCVELPSYALPKIMLKDRKI